MNKFKEYKVDDQLKISDFKSKHLSAKYVSWLNDEEVIIFYFKDYGFINDNKSNTYDLSVGKAGITVNIKKTKYD